MQVTNKNIFEEEEGSLFSQVLFKYLPYWPLFLILLVLASFSECTFSFGGAIALGCQGFVVTLLIALVFIFDRPFKRRILSPQPITKAIAEMQNRVSTGD